MEEKKDASTQEIFFEALPCSDGEKTASNGGMVALNVPNQPKKEEKIKVGHIFLAVGIALVSFVGGFFTHRGMLDKEMLSLINVKQAIDENYYTEIDNDTFYGVLFDAINNQLLDPYSRYMTADEYAEFNEAATGTWSGLGLSFLIKDTEGKDQMLIAKVSGNSPAEKQGILEGDKIIGYGATEESVTDNQSFEEFSKFLQPYEAGRTFVLKIASGEQTRLVNIAKEAFVENYVFYRSKTTAYTFTGENATDKQVLQNSLSALSEDTAYIRLTQFNGSASQQFASTMSLFKEENKKNLILDLRANGGGYLNILCDIASYFCKDSSESAPLVAVAIDKNGNQENYKATKNLYKEYFSQDSRICILADSSSASASECLIGALLDYQTINYADICLSERNGEAKTYGKGIMQMTYPFGLGNEDAIKLTTAKIYWPISRNCIHGRGIVSSDGTKTVAENYQKDAELIAAISALGL